MATLPTEKAVLTVDGVKYEDWESVLVRMAVKENPPYRYRFTCSEGVPIDKNFAVMRIRPGMTCSVTLAGFPAITGVVHTRQVFADARRHYVEIQGATRSADAANASFVTKTGELNDRTLEQIAREAFQPLGVNVVVDGKLPEMKFKRTSIAHGQNILEVLDPLARMLGLANNMSISFTSNPNGDFVIHAGHLSTQTDSVIEGQNMLEAREIIYNPAAYSGLTAVGQGPGTNTQHGTKVASEPYASQQGQDQMSNKTDVSTGKESTGGGDASNAPSGTARYMPKVVTTEIPVTNKQQVEGRAGFDARLAAEDQVTIIATVYGWLRPSGGLWAPEQVVKVVSPMLIMDGSQQLFVYAVTFTQDNHTGTRSQLELKNAAAYGGLKPSLGPA